MTQAKLILITLLLLQALTASAQFSMIIRESLVTNDVSTLWSINLAYTGTKAEEDLQMKLSVMNDNDKTIYEVLSPYLVLKSNEVRQLSTGFTIAQTITDEMTSPLLPDGNYEVVYRENKSSKLLKRKQFKVNGASVTFSNEVDSGKFDLKKWLNTTGSARVTTAFNNPQGLQSEQKEFYTRFEFNPTVILMNTIPITASVLLTTEQNSDKQPMNQVSVNFDYNYFRTLMEQKAMAKIEALKSGQGMDDMKGLKDKYIREKNKGYEAMKEKLSSPENKEKLAKADEYNSLEKQSANLEKEIDQDKMNKLKKRYKVNTMEDLEARKGSMPEKDYKELKFQMTTSAAYDDAQARMAKLEDAKDDAKKLEKDKAKLDKIENTDYMQMMRDPKYNKEIMNKLGLNNPGIKLLGSLKSFSIGSSYPLYSELTMNGVRCSGFNIELNPGIFYAAFTNGTIHNQRYDTALRIYDFNQKVMAGRLGIGKKNATHFILTYVNTTERGNAFMTPSDSVTHNPGSNLVVGAEMQISLFRKKFITQAEINGTMTTADINAPGIPTTGEKDEVGDALKNINYKQNLTTRRDIAYTARTQLSLFKDNTVLSGSYSYIGPGYTTFTAPYLLNDLLKYEGKLSQSFWKKRVTIGGFYRYMTDDVFHSKSFQTTVNGYGAEFSITIPKVPSLWAKYLPVNQVSNFAVSGQVAQLASNMTQAGSSYNFNFLDVSCNTQLMYSQYDIRDQLSGLNILMSTYMVVQNVAFKNGMNWGVNGFYNTSPGAGSSGQSGYALSESSIIIKKIIAGAELHYLQQGTTISKTGGMLNVGVKIIKQLNAQVRLTYNSIKDPILGNRTETYGNVVVSLGW